MHLIALIFLLPLSALGQIFSKELGISRPAKDGFRNGSKLDTPMARDFAMSWSLYGYYYLFGGEVARGPSNPETVLNDLWNWQDNNGWFWTSLIPTNANTIPRPRRKGVTASDLANGRLYLFGGEFPSASDVNYLSDLWYFSPPSSTWILQSGSNLPNQISSLGVNSAPGARSSAHLWNCAYNILCLYGGYGLSDSTLLGYLQDLWTYSYTTGWSYQRSGNLSNSFPSNIGKGINSALNWPGARSGGATWLADSYVSWLFGGQLSPTTFLNDLWLFNGKNWTFVSGQNISARANACLWRYADAFHVFGGNSAVGYWNDVWSFDGTSWKIAAGNSTFPNNLPNYGTVQVPAPFNSIGARRSPCVFASDGVFTFGGYGYTVDGAKVVDYGNDVWKIKVGGSGNGYTWISGSNGRELFSSSSTIGARYNAMSWQNAGYKWIFGGYGNGQNSQGVLSDLYRYGGLGWTYIGGSKESGALNIGTKSISLATNWPGARHSAGVAATSNFTVIHGGVNPDLNPSVLSDTWVYSGGIWTWTSGPGPAVYGQLGIMNSNNSMGPRESCASWALDAAVYFFGGSDGSTVKNDVWKYDGNWTWIGGTQDGNYSIGPKGVTLSTNIPPPRSAHASWWDTSANKLWIFGGTNKNNLQTNDLWTWDSGGLWTWISGNPGVSVSNSEISPPARAYGFIWMSPLGITLFGGLQTNGSDTNYLNDIWSFSDNWYSLSTSNTFNTPTNNSIPYPGGRAGFVGWPSSDGSTCQFAVGVSMTVLDRSSLVNDVWKLVLPPPPQTTGRITSGSLTSSPLTTQPLTTSPLTTGAITTSPITTQKLTTSPITTQEMTTSPLTTDTPSITTQILVTSGLATSGLSGISVATTSALDSQIDSAYIFSSSSSSFPFGAIIGGVMGLVALISISIIAFLVIRRKNHTKSEELELQNQKAKGSATSASSVAPLVSKNQDNVKELHDIEIKHRLGGGNFGDVWGDTAYVALKTLKEGVMSPQQVKEFKKELSTLSSLGSHPNVVQFHGIFRSEKFSTELLVFEYCGKGSLQNYVREFVGNPNELLALIIGVCSGMAFLEDKKIIHRDLSARNCLVTEVDGRITAKVTDFGMSRASGDTDSNYYAAASAPIPVRWSAPECFLRSKFSSASDVWSFGVLCWEVYSRGDNPYSWLSNKEVSEQVPEGLRLSAPKLCPEYVWEVISSCWALDPAQRPTFRTLVKSLKDTRTRSNSTLPTLKDLSESEVIYNSNEENYITK